jgi:hypothetical protein
VSVTGRRESFRIGCRYAILLELQWADAIGERHMTKEQLIREIDRIPEERLAEVFDFVHYFRLGLESEADGNPTMQLAGAWSDMGDTDFDAMLAEMSERRSAAFNGRQRHKQDAD